MSSIAFAFALEAAVVLGRARGTPTDGLEGVGFVEGGRVLLGTSWTGLNLYRADGALGEQLRPPGFGTLSAVSPDGRRLLVTRGGRAEVVTSATGEVVCAFDAAPALVGPARFSADGLRVLTTASSPGAGRAFALWDAASCAQVRHFEGHTGAPLASLLFGPGEKTIVSANRQSIREWSAATGALLREFKTSATVALVLPDGLQVRVEGGTVELVAADGTTSLARWKLPYTNVFSLALVPGTSVVLIGGMNVAFVLDLRARDQGPQPLPEQATSGHDFVAIAVAPDGARAWLVDARGQALLFDVGGRAVLGWAKVPGASGPPR